MLTGDVSKHIQEDTTSRSFMMLKENATGTTVSSQNSNIGSKGKKKQNRIGNSYLALPHHTYSFQIH